VEHFCLRKANSMDRDQKKRAPLNGFGKRPRRNLNSVLARRESLVTEVALLRSRGGPSTFADSAQTLLTRFWSARDLNAQEDLLKSVEWLVLLERRREAAGIRQPI
jgi:hypothetical protein